MFKIVELSLLYLLSSITYGILVILFSLFKLG